VAAESPRLARLAKSIDEGVPGALDAFWREVTESGAPLVERLGDGSALVTFLWRGQARSVATDWGVRFELTRLAGTDLWYATERMSTDVRTVYYFRRDGARGKPCTPNGDGPVHVDPANPRRLRFPADPGDPTDQDTWVSILELADAPVEQWSISRPGVARGRLLRHTIRSATLGGRRRVWVYRPAGVPTAGLPSLVVFDGYLARTVLRIPTTLDNLIAARQVPPLVALFVATSNGKRRLRELSPGRPIRDFLTGELMPWARRRWGLATDPARNVVAGVSMGGLAAAYAGLCAPDVFGAVIAQSGSFWWAPPGAEPGWLARRFADGPRLPLRFYLDVGSRETEDFGRGLTQVAANRQMRDALLARGYPVTYVEYAGGHDYVNWRRTFADAMLAVLSGAPGPASSSR
jgi:enterochelin esterase family protein